MFERIRENAIFEGQVNQFSQRREKNVNTLFHNVSGAWIKGASL